MKAKLTHRFRMAWCAFWLIPFDIQLEPYHKTGYARNSIGCDNRSRTGCQGRMEIFLEQTRAEFRVRECDSYILCKECAAKAIGTTEKLDFDFSLPE